MEPQAAVHFFARIPDRRSYCFSDSSYLPWHSSRSFGSMTGCGASRLIAWILTYVRWMALAKKYSTYSSWKQYSSLTSSVSEEETPGLAVAAREPRVRHPPCSCCSRSSTRRPRDMVVISALYNSIRLVRIALTGIDFFATETCAETMTRRLASASSHPRRTVFTSRPSYDVIGWS